MAQTSTRRKPSRGSRTQRANGSTPSSSSRGRRASRPRSASSSRSRSQRSSAGPSGPTETVKEVASKGKDAASKLKGPALAGGAALLGLAGGVALGSSRSGRKMMGMRVGNGVGNASKNLADASKNVGRFGDNLGQFAAEMQAIREAIENGSKGRSPIEVTLRALTARR